MFSGDSGGPHDPANIVVVFWFLCRGPQILWKTIHSKTPSGNGNDEQLVKFGLFSSKDDFSFQVPLQSKVGTADKSDSALDFNADIVVDVTTISKIDMTRDLSPCPRSLPDPHASLLFAMMLILPAYASRGHSL